jgi:hypothetical protein
MSISITLLVFDWHHSKLKWVTMYGCYRLWWSRMFLFLSFLWCGFLYYCLCRGTKLLIFMTLGIRAWTNIFQLFVKMGVMWLGFGMQPKEFNIIWRPGYCLKRKLNTTWAEHCSEMLCFEVIICLQIMWRKNVSWRVVHFLFKNI